jgi:hypothetical protein
MLALRGPGHNPSGHIGGLATLDSRQGLTKGEAQIGAQPALHDFGGS